MMAGRADLWWLPVGAGGHVVVHTSRWWEHLHAHREHRTPQPLFHAALEVFVDGDRNVIEMTPAWGQPPGPRGVVVVGPVGGRLLGRSRFFRYEIRCWPDGVLPDRAYAIDSPVSIPLGAAEARVLLDRVAVIPALVWGREAAHSGDMWNSNSVISWLLTTGGVDASELAPPAGGRAPGWKAGIACATSLRRG